MEYRLLLHGARQIVQITDSPDVAFIVGEKEMNNIKVLESDKNNLALLVDSDGRIAKIGTDEELQAEADRMGCETRMNADGGVLMPGFVDAHSHPVFAGDRVHEFAMKLAGVTYSEIQEKGGGILFTMNKTREASEDELLSNFERSAIEMMKSGTTTLEAKSGYGLDTSNEMKLLNVIAMADEILPFEISGTFCGGHAIPKDSSEDRQTEMIVNDMLPAIVAEKNAGGLSCIENIDVFCEKGNFGVDSTRRILEAGMDAGLSVNFHAEELHRTGGAEMGAEIKAKAMSHLEHISRDAIKAMAQSGTVAVLLPTTAHLLRLSSPPARELIGRGVIVALGSDFNPNAYCLAMPIVMYLACINMHLSMPEALVAATINAAYSLNRGKTHGALSVGRFADIIVVGAPKWEHIIYQFGCHRSLIQKVIKKGELIHENEDRM